MLHFDKAQNQIEINASSMNDAETETLATLVGTYAPSTIHPSMYISINFGNPFYLENLSNKETIMQDINNFLDIVYNKYKQTHS